MGQVNAVCLDLWVQELVPASVRVSSRLVETGAVALDAQTRIDTALSLIANDKPGTVGWSESGLCGSDDVSVRVEACGYKVGVRMGEWMAANAFGGGRVEDVLDIMKFVCRDVWKAVYGKQMDNLRTNHRGTFVLVDNKHRLVAHLSSSKGTQDTLAKAQVYLWYPCGIIRGVLAGFGIDSTVAAEIAQFPAVTFNIHTAINN